MGRKRTLRQCPELVESGHCLAYAAGMAQPRIRRLAAMLLYAMISASCDPGSPQRVLTVEEFVPRIDELNGQTVSVSGYLSQCGGYDCILYRNQADADEWRRFMAAVHANQRTPFPPEHPMVGIGTGTNSDFDAKAAPFDNGYVVITGTVTNECRFQGKPACTDRGPDINPTSIQSAGRVAR
jgi:hypothetical protein